MKPSGPEPTGALERSESLLKLALEAAQMGTWELDPASCELRIHGREGGWAEGSGRTLHVEALRRYIHHDDFGAVREQFLAAMVELRRFNAEFRVLVGGRVRWLRVAGMPDEHGRMVGVLEDISHRRQQVEQLREAARRKDQFIATLGHELRNPLAPIRYAGQAIGRSSDPAAQRAAAVIERQVASMARLLDQLLDLTRITHGRIELDRKPLALVPLARQSLEDIRPWAEDTGRTLLFTAPAPLWVKADAVRLKQVLDHLLNNAMKFGAEGGRVALRILADRRNALIQVTDDGVGIEADELESIFEPLVQVHGGANVDLRGGLGVGLALVRTLVLLHGGDVRACSRGRGSGSTFEVVLPLAHSPEAAADAESGAA